jgi:peptidoglycan/LPS O-acetylase OafA/YrhL
MAVFTMPPKLFRDFGATVTAAALFTSNIIFWRKQSNYFDDSSDWSPLLHTWSLGIEEQFYILFPLFLPAIWRGGKTFRQLLIGFALMCSFALCVWGTRNAPTATFYLLPTRAWKLLIGAFVAFGPRGVAAKTADGDGGSRPFIVAMGILGLLCVRGVVWV